MKWKIRRSRETALFHFTGPSPQDTSQETQKGTASHVCDRRARARELRAASCDLTSSKSRIHSCSKCRSCENKTHSCFNVPTSCEKSHKNTRSSSTSSSCEFCFWSSSSRKMPREAHAREHVVRKHATLLLTCRPQTMTMHSLETKTRKSPRLRSMLRACHLSHHVVVVQDDACRPIGVQ